uniref:Zona pellucida sperm-binding protein 3 n=1 Tax=Monopterus albus TaxID=43700 RepID=A0A3Q3IRM9_MONAL
MEPLLFWVNLLVGLFLSGFCLGSSFAFPPTHYTGHALFQRPRLEQSQSSQYAVQAPAEERNKVDTVRVMCHPDSLEIVIKADMFGVGAPVNAHELRLGVEHNHVCRATTSKEDEYRIVVGLTDCGTKHWMSDDSLVYTNLLLYSPEASPDWLIRMEEAVVPIECHYGRKYSLSSLSLAPNWIPFMSTQAAEQTFKLDLRTMTDNWLYTRSSNVFYVGEPISIEASVTVGHHIGLRVFVSSCVATLDPNKDSTPRYVFIENGCLVDSQFPGSKSHFLFRTRHDKLHFIIDAFKFHNEDKGELYITCQLNAVLVNDAEAPNKACTFVKGRWRSADSNDYLCQYCQSQSKASSPGKSEPHGVGKPPETLWGSGLKTNNVLEHDTTVGPMLVLPVKPKSWPLTVEELPLHKLRPALYGSQWRSGVNVDGTAHSEVGPTPQAELAAERDGTTSTAHSEVSPTPQAELAAERDGTTSTAHSEVSPTPRVGLAAEPDSNSTTTLSNASDLKETSDPER